MDKDKVREAIAFTIERGGKGIARYFEAVEILRNLAQSVLDNKLVERDIDQNIMCKICDRIEPMSEEEIIKAMDSREDYTESYSTKKGERNNLCLGEILSGENIDKVAKALVGHIGKKQEVREFNPQSMDAKKWAKEFMRTFKEKGLDTTEASDWIDEGLMLGWFANAIMAGYDEARRRYESKQEPPITNGLRPLGTTGNFTDDMGNIYKRV